MGAIRITHGYSRDHRPHLKQGVMNLICADTGGIPLRFAPGDGNQSDRGALVPLLTHYRQALDLGEVVVLDGAGYGRENLWTPEGFSWILGVPATLKEARALLGGAPSRMLSRQGKTLRRGSGARWEVHGRGRRPWRWATASWPG